MPDYYVVNMSIWSPQYEMNIAYTRTPYRAKPWRRFERGGPPGKRNGAPHRPTEHPPPP